MESTRKIPLTAVQQKVYDLDLAGQTPSKIAEQTGLSLARVSNVRKRLRELGYEVLEWRKKRPANDNADPVQEPTRPVPPCVVSRFVRQFCRCGLTLPCNQCLDSTELGAYSQPAETETADEPSILNGGHVKGRKLARLDK